MPKHSQEEINIRYYSKKIRKRLNHVILDHAFIKSCDNALFGKSELRTQKKKFSAIYPGTKSHFLGPKNPFFEKFFAVCTRQNLVPNTGSSGIAQEKYSKNLYFVP